MTTRSCGRPRSTDPTPRRRCAGPLLPQLGAIAGDMALAHGAIGGGVRAGWVYACRTSAALGLRERFIAKGRFERMMDEIPVKLISHPQPGLFGAAAAFAPEHP